MQGFTSAISALVPLAGELLHPGWGFPVMRLASLAAGVATILFANQVALRLGFGTWGRALLLGYLSVDYLQIFYGMSGMETQIAVAVVFAVIWAVESGRHKTAGALIGLSVLVRPDFVLLAAPAFAVLALRSRREWRKVALAGAMAVLVAGPWITFATAYYGSPVPQTITAKSLVFSHPPALREGVGVWAYFLHDSLSDQWRTGWTALAPFNENPAVNGWTAFKLVTILILGLAAVGLAARRKNRGLDIAVAFAFAFEAYLLVFTPPPYFRWYLPPFLAVLVLFAAGGADALARRARALSAAVVVVLLAAYAGQALVLFPFERTVQTKIEDRVREPLGRYLARVVPAGQTVVTESSGYIGESGRVRLLDFPGLTSRRASEILQRLQPEARNLYSLIDFAKPDWIVLRATEQPVFQHLSPELYAHYRVVRRFAVSQSSSRLQKWGISMANIDRDFRLLKRVR